MQLSLHFPTRFMDRWGTIVLLNVVDKVILVRGSVNGIRAGAKGEAIVTIQNQPAGNSYCKDEFPPETNIIIQLWHNSCTNSKGGCVFVRSRVRRGHGGFWTGACTRGKTDGSVIATLEQGR